MCSRPKLRNTWCVARVATRLRAPLADFIEYDDEPRDLHITDTASARRGRGVVVARRSAARQHRPALFGRWRPCDATSA